MKDQNASVRSSWFQLVIFLLFAPTVFLIYSNTLHSPFIYDDTGNVVEDRYIRMSEITPDQVAEILKNPSSRPVAEFSFALNYYFGKYNPTGLPSCQYPYPSDRRNTAFPFYKENP